jgi:uncharacterized protein
MPLYEKLLFFPGRDYGGEGVSYMLQEIAEKYHVERRVVRFAASDGTVLSGWYFARPGARKIVMVSHGNAGNISNRLILASALLGCDVSVLLYDYRGYGSSGGSPSLSGICQDGLAAFDYLVMTEKILPGDIVVYGESIGSGVACSVSQKREVGGIVLQSGFPSLVYAAHDRLWFTWLYPQQWFDNLDNLRALRDKHAPLLIIHGNQDMIFPARYAEVIAKKASEPKELLEISSMGHTVDDPNDRLFQSAIANFINRLPRASEAKLPK